MAAALRKGGEDMNACDGITEYQCCSESAVGSGLERSLISSSWFSAGKDWQLMQRIAGHGVEKFCWGPTI